MRLSRLMFAAVLSAACTLAAGAAAAAPVTVFAAASLANALPAIGKAYKARTGHDVVFSFAASSVVAKQIDASGGADIFVSADESWMDFLEKRGRIVPASRENLLGNHLVLIAPKTSHIAVRITPHFDLLKALDGGRLAVADTKTVPAGRYAREALTKLGVWNQVAAHLASAENVRVALAYVARDQSPLGVVYKTDALIEPAVRIVATFPDSSHKPIVYPAALVKGARAGAAKLLAFLKTAPARAIFEKAGFSVLP